MNKIEEFARLPRTAKQAKAAGSKFYFTGKPCSHGHIVPRYVSCRSCVECNRIASSQPRLAAPAAAVNILFAASSVPAGLQKLIRQLVSQGVSVSMEVRQ